MSFCHLHVHSYYSFLHGADAPEQLVVQAKRHGMAALALTDTNGLYGAVPFQTACRQHGIKAIFGAWLDTGTQTCLVLATSNDGYKTLCRIITALQLHERETDFDLISALLQDHTGLVVAAQETTLLMALKGTIPANYLYVEVTPTTKALAWSAHRETRLPMLATNALWFAQPEGYDRHRLLTAIGLNSSLGRLHPNEIAAPTQWLAPDEQMHRAFSELPQALVNTQRVAELCDFTLTLGELKLPRFPFTQGATSYDLLERKTETGIKRRYGTPSAAVRKQVTHELRLIRDLGYTDYFLIVADIVDAARAMGIPTCGRGSAANSVVAYALDLTHVEPLAHNLYFERFLNRGRSDCPDVDIDFSWCERDRVIDWVIRRYGRDRVAMISTHVTFAARGAVREIAKVLGVPGDEITQITRRLPSGWYDGPIADWIGKDPRARNLPIADEPWKTVFAEATAIIGYPKHLGVHSGGIVIAPSVLTDHLPLQLAAKETADGHLVVTQWDMYPVEDAGLVKIDLLGNRSLAVINDAVAAIGDNTGVRIDYTQFSPQEDIKTKNLIRQGATVGCFYIESPSMRNLLQKLRCDRFDTLVAASSIIRPGISSSGMMQAYIERFHHVLQHGTQDPGWYLHPLMQSILEETFGVMAYQEDVLKVAESVARMSPEDADGLRKSMSKKRDFIAISRYHRQFIAGACGNGCPPAVADELWRQIESFSGYSFCKAHSASYALISFQAAYLRAHYPAEFLAAVLDNHGGYYSTFAYVSEARRLGLQVLSPCVNAGIAEYTGQNNQIRVGLTQIRGLHSESITQLLRARENRPFADFGDLVARTMLADAEIDALIRSGACDSIAGSWNRPQLMRAHVLMSGPAIPSATPALFTPALPAIPCVSDLTLKEQMAMETEALGFPLVAHPLELYQDSWKRRCTATARQLQNRIGQTVTLAGWQVARKRLRTRKDEPMVFITFEDAEGLYETVLFPRTYALLAPLTARDGPFLVTGTVIEEYGAVTLNVSNLELLSENTTRKRQRTLMLKKL